MPREDADTTGDADFGGASRRTLLRSLGAVSVVGAVAAGRWIGPWDRPFTLARPPASTLSSADGAGPADDSANDQPFDADDALATERVPTPTTALRRLVAGSVAAAELDPLTALLAEKAGLGTVVLQASGGIPAGEDPWTVESVLAAGGDGIDSAAALGGETVVLGAPLRAVDSLYPMAAIEEATAEPPTLRWIERGSATGAATVAGAPEATPVVGTAARNAERAGLSIVASAGKLPRPVIVAGNPLPAAERERFVAAAFDAADDRQGWFGTVRRRDAAALDAVAERAADAGIHLDAL
ncbi:ABC transporter, phosphonate, substrate-binding protein [Natronoarchaeum philippinense]|uniref:ABC transporter, phosphonate, substrate-binding protein n=1 Tax=Natronoarchaeum philippinense TaxID=558529 RepID=A0A285NBE3_NATPI|nr:PhnD/SsuA/transferrin family substrate-binding protein [Natronoarchaeum philippinense]SNZ06739.1 ABC transporter, phosphonate, substrate-binding protein [Natronoarchaeum philippinense]